MSRRRDPAPEPDEDEFEPIEVAFDHLLEKLGWRGP